MGDFVRLKKISKKNLRPEKSGRLRAILLFKQEYYQIGGDDVSTFEQAVQLCKSVVNKKDGVFYIYASRYGGQVNIKSDLKEFVGQAVIHLTKGAIIYPRIKEVESIVIANDPNPKTIFIKKASIIFKKRQIEITDLSSETVFTFGYSSIEKIEDKITGHILWP